VATLWSFFKTSGADTDNKKSLKKNKGNDDAECFRVTYTF